MSARSATFVFALCALIALLFLTGADASVTNSTVLSGTNSTLNGTAPTLGSPQQPSGATAVTSSAAMFCALLAVRALLSALTSTALTHH